MGAQAQNRLAVILHADVVDSTALVRRDEVLAHGRIRDAFRRLAGNVREYGGIPKEIRGDALVAEFDRASDALCAAIAFQLANAQANAAIHDGVAPRVRIGVAMGEVVVADGTVTGPSVVLAQRIEQLADADGVCVQGAAYETVPSRLGLEFVGLGEQAVKGFDDPVRVYSVRLKPGRAVPPPSGGIGGGTGAGRRARKRAVAATLVVAMALAGIGWWVYSGKVGTALAGAEAPYPVPSRPSVAVLAFENLTGDPSKEYLSDGLSENIITALSRFSQLFVIARQSSFRYKNQAVSVQDVGRELGVRYVLEGSLQIIGSRVRVTAQLINAPDGTHVWADQYDNPLDDFFVVQDEIIRAIVSTLKSNIDFSEYQRAKLKPTRSLSAYEAWAVGTAHWFKATEADNEKARELYERARTIDPEYADAYRGLAWVHINGARWGWGSEDRKKSAQLALEYANKAVELEPFNHRMYQAKAAALIHLGRLDDAVAAFDRALEINPNDASVLAHAAAPLIYAGRAADAVVQIKRAVELNPHGPNWYYWTLGFAQYFAGDYQGAVESIKHMRELTNLARRPLAAAYVRLGRVDDARATIATLLENDPGDSIEKVRLNFEGKFKHPADLGKFIADLRVAGLPG